MSWSNDWKYKYSEILYNLVFLPVFLVLALIYFEVEWVMDMTALGRFALILVPAVIFYFSAETLRKRHKKQYFQED